MKKKILITVSVAALAVIAVVLLLPKGQAGQTARTTIPAQAAKLTSTVQPGAAAREPVTLLVTADQPFTLTNAEGQYCKYDGKNPEITGTMKILSQQWTPTQPASEICLTVNYSASFTYQGALNAKDSFSLIDKEAYANLEKTNADKITITTGKGAEGMALSGGQGKYTMHVIGACNSGEEVTLSGKYAKEVTLREKTQGVYLTGTSGDTTFTSDVVGTTGSKEKTVQFVRDAGTVAIGHLGGAAMNAPVTVSGAKII